MATFTHGFTGTGALSGDFEANTARSYRKYLDALDSLPLGAEVYVTIEPAA